MAGSRWSRSDRPDRLNALDRARYEDLSDAWCQIRDDDNIWTAVITGAGEASFCVGADLKEASAREQQQWWRTHYLPLLNNGLDLWKPVIAAVN
jgi:E-phenylitaconyl-CoA hydratase